jgi:hypothetical protein
MIAEFRKASSITEMFSLPFSVLCNNNTEQKKMPVEWMTGTTQDRAKRLGIRHGATPGAAPSTITHIGCVYADEPSIWAYRNKDMT